MLEFVFASRCIRLIVEKLMDVCRLDANADVYSSMALLEGSSYTES